MLATLQYYGITMARGRRCAGAIYIVVPLVAYDIAAVAVAYAAVVVYGEVPDMCGAACGAPLALAST